MGKATNDGGETQRPDGLFLHRYATDGSLDQTFGINGKLFILKAGLFNVEGGQ